MTTDILSPESGTVFWNKVYFYFEDAAIFVFAIIFKDDIILK